MLRIAVCGDGAIALSIAAVCAWRGHRVRVLSDSPGRWRGSVSGHLPDGSPIAGPLACVTHDPRTAVRGADVVFICVRHYELLGTLRSLAPHVNPETLVGAIPGFGGFGFLARRTMPRVKSFFGTQRIPFVVDRHVRARRVSISGVRRQTFVASIPAPRAPAVADLVSEVLGVPTVPVSHFINVELSPSNSLVNPARLYSLFGRRARRSPTIGAEFFTDWDASASRDLLALDRELQTGRGLIPRDTSFVAPILLQYDSNDAATLTKRFRGLRTLARRPVPLRRRNGKVTLDPRSDYVREDVDFGLVLIRETLHLAGAGTAFMDEIIEWRRTCVPTSRAWAAVAKESPISAFHSIQALVSALD